LWFFSSLSGTIVVYDSCLLHYFSEKVALVPNTYRATTHRICGEISLSGIPAPTSKETQNLLRLLLLLLLI
jgi:hypothetical protein